MERTENCVSSERVASKGLTTTTSNIYALYVDWLDNTEIFFQLEPVVPVKLDKHV